MDKVFSKGERVMAKVRGWTTHQPAVIIAKETDHYTVQLVDGVEERVLLKNVKTEKKPYRKSPARTDRSPSRRSPARKVSPSPVKKTKSPNRTKSPARRKSQERDTKKKEDVKTTETTKSQKADVQTPPRGRPKKAASPAQKRVSPARKGASPARKGASPARKETKKKSEIPVAITDSILEVNLEKPKASVRGRTRNLKPIELDTDSDDDLEDEEEEQAKISTASTVIRRSARISLTREPERVLHLKPNYESVVEKLTEFSDEDELIKNMDSARKSKSVTRSGVPTELGGTVGATLILLMSICAPLYVLTFCNDRSCSFTKVPDLQKYKQLKTYLTVPAVASISGYVALTTLLSCLPFGGRKVTGPPNKAGRLEYVANGLFSLVVVLLTVAALQFYSISVANIIADNYLRHTVISLALGLLVSVALNIKSFLAPVSSLNPHGINGTGLYNFVMGREVNPRILKRLDVKMCLFRAAFIRILLINAAYLYKGISVSPQILSNETIVYNWSSVSVSATLLASAAMQSVYALDGLVFEAQWPFAFEIQYEGAGAMFVLGYLATYPALLPAITKYVYEHKVQLPVWHLAICALLFTVGYVIYRASNSQKNAFRKNPYSPALAHLESIPTTQGKSLLVSGWWGRVRHPNYLGHILMSLACLLLAWNVPASIICYLSILFLIQRATRDGARCRQRYGAAWERYCQRVKYALVPKVY